MVVLTWEESVRGGWTRKPGPPPGAVGGLPGAPRGPPWPNVNLGTGSLGAHKSPGAGRFVVLWRPDVHEGIMK